ncbi:MAG: hypothetical protein FVQ84_09280 [Planctomycetes bacterium]|nr:hypothetical protein [Planctomycetota bacterium]
MNIWKLVQTLFVVFIIVLVIPGCNRDPVIEELKHLKEKAKTKDFVDEERHIESALSKWQNQTVDPEPILLTGDLSKSRGHEHMYLGFITFDEDMDVYGLGINEVYTDVNSMKVSLTEEYPAFVHRMKPEVLDFRLFPVQIRDAGQRKNEQQWDKYVKGEGIDVNEVRELNLWRATLPPVWVSIPEPNGVNVYVYIYDRAGNKSDPIKLFPPDYIAN